MPHLKFRSKLFFTHGYEDQKLWNRSRIFRQCQSPKGDRNCVILSPICQIYIRLKATQNPSLNKLKFLILENICSHHVCYCGNKKKWLKLRLLTEKNPRLISMEKWERKCETRNIITGLYISAPMEVMALSPAPNPVYTTCIKYTDNVSTNLYWEGRIQYSCPTSEFVNTGPCLSLWSLPGASQWVWRV